MPVVSAIDLCRSFGERLVLDHVSCAIQRGERVGLVGANGSGKSTLGRILAGVDKPDAGEVAPRRDARIAYLGQFPDLQPGQAARDVALSGLEDWCRTRARYEALSAEIGAGQLDDASLAQHIEAQAKAAEELEHLGGWDLVHRAEAVLGHLGIADVEADVGCMSGGEQRRVALAKVLVAQPDFAVLDEPTNHLDLDTVDWLERFLIDEYRGALLLITHDRYLLDRVATRTFELSRGKLYRYDGGYETYLAARAERQALEERTEQNRQRYLRNELEWLRRQPKARTTKSQARIDRIEAAAAIDKPRAERRAELAVAESRSGKTILELHGLGIDLAGRSLVRGLTLHLTQGERVGIVGPNGCGKSTLLRCVRGDLEPTSGSVVRGVNTRIAFLDQLRSGLDDAATVFENAIGDLGVIRIGDRELTPRSYLEGFLFDYAGQKTRVGSLSGGERARVALAKLLAQPANLLVLDEPTNDLDVETLESLEGLLLEFGGSVLVVTHDRYFLDRIATSILAFEEDGRVVRHHGSYADYLEARRQRQQEEKAATRPAARPVEARATKPTKLSRAEENERQALPDRIEAAEQEVAALERQLADPELYATRGAEVAGLLSQLEEAKHRVEQLVERWEDLETRAEAARGTSV